MVEVADSSIGFDLNKKAALYSKHEVPEYWVLELDGAVMHQLWSPSPQGYREGRSIELGQQIDSVTIAGLAIESDGLI